MADYKGNFYSTDAYNPTYNVSELGIIRRHRVTSDDVTKGYVILHDHPFPSPKAEILLMAYDSGDYLGINGVLYSINTTTIDNHTYYYFTSAPFLFAGFELIYIVQEAQEYINNVEINIGT